ncbi:response regulator [Pedobacter yonginense]|uniref:Response regulator n=1 Tax=Pedobacter yonginense TaxID=651869 RepID=A0A317EP25_9SPHI|nr:response regulator transcription factor [Pedobacter yonginense]PWS28571.1 response regulator [Pedobacter yonginense]
MFRKVLIAEDHEMTSISVTKTISELGIADTQYTYYCDDAMMLLKKAQQAGAPFDLLITDLSFEEDHRKQKIAGGEELIALSKSFQPNLKVLVFSAENKSALVDKLFTDFSIDAYVRKARHDAKDLRAAIEAIAQGKKYMTADLKQSVKVKNTFEFSSIDLTILKLLSAGTKQKDIPAYLQANKITPSGLSSVEKRLNIMKEVMGFSKNEQLIAYCKDYGII